MTTEQNDKKLPNGPAIATLLAAAIGCFTLGLLTVLSEASAFVHDLLPVVTPVGPLSGKAVFAVIVWLATWMLLKKRWQDRELPVRPYAWAIGVLVVLGLLGTFPPFFYLFGAH